MVDTLQQNWIDVESCLLLLERTELAHIPADIDDGFVYSFNFRGFGEISKESIDVLIDNFDGGRWWYFAVVLSHENV